MDIKDTLRMLRGTVERVRDRTSPGSSLKEVMDILIEEIDWDIDLAEKVRRNFEMDMKDRDRGR
ncbi:MAG: hypothetical protein IH935_11960 [Acidobacteria bacterium]|nr:hypothetical protein [Acidobacteriota bacterium]